MKFQNIKWAISGLAFTAAVIGCSLSGSRGNSADGRPTAAELAEGKAITQTAAQDIKAHDFEEIRFATGSAILTEGSKSALDRIMTKAAHSGKINEVLVMSWSDEELPAQNGRKLKKVQRDLAEKRNMAVEKYIKNGRNLRVDLYNMAEKPTIFAKWFNTSDSKLKKSFVDAGLPTTADDNQYPSKASHSVVLIKLE